MFSVLLLNTGYLQQRHTLGLLKGFNPSKSLCSLPCKLLQDHLKGMLTSHFSFKPPSSCIFTSSRAEHDLYLTTNQLIWTHAALTGSGLKLPKWISTTARPNSLGVMWNAVVFCVGGEDYNSADQSTNHNSLLYAPFPVHRAKSVFPGEVFPQLPSLCCLPVWIQTVH